MRPSPSLSVGLASLLCLFSVAGSAAAAAPAGTDDVTSPALVGPPAGGLQGASPLAPFGRLVGGRWHDGEGSWHEFEWGVRRRLVRTRSFFEVDGEPTLVAEGIWYWHPGRHEIVGHTVAVEMPVDLFDYTTRFEGDRMINELVSYGSAGGRYREVWEFVDDDHYTWTLYQVTGSGEERIMSARYERRR